MFGSSPFSYAPGGLSPEDLSHRRNIYHDDQRVSPVQKNNMSRPTGRSIYMQRKEYSESLSKQPDDFHVRVEHLFTCDLDGRDVSSISDCVAKLKRLDSKGRVWSQEMILELQGGYVVLCDIETKSELDSLPLNSITETNAVLDTCAYNSLLTLTVHERNKRTPQVYMFQCEETGAEVVKADLDKAIQKGGQERVEPRMEPRVEPRVDLRREPSEIRTNLENIIGQHVSGGYRPEGPRAVLRDRITPSPEPVAPWSREPEIYPPEDSVFQPEPFRSQFDKDMGPPPLSDTERNTEIFNHVLNDLEIFMADVSAAVNAASQLQGKKKKKSKKKKGEPAVSLPAWVQYVSFLQKIKYGFNLLGQLDGALTEPNAEDYIHILFSMLMMMVPQYAPDLPPTVVSPLLTEAALSLMGNVVTAEEDELWGSLGDSWIFSRSQWPEDDVPPYIPEFNDGWQPPPPSQNRPVSRSISQRYQSEPVNGWGTPPPSARTSEPMLMRAMYDLTARNNRELSLMKGDVVEVIQKNKQWWLVRNNRNEEGHVPQNVLESLDEPQRDGPARLDMNSSSAEVTAWLAYKGFSKMTVKSLGVLNGRQLLGMSKDDIRAVCPEDGGKVFFQLQAIKTAIALASEPSGPYNGRY